jgi:hypothetical protein
MCRPFLNLFVWYDAHFHGWCVAYVGDISVSSVLNFVSSPVIACQRS